MDVRGATYYNLAYCFDVERYTVHYSYSMYFPIWLSIIDILKQKENVQILEIGCGPGQLARMLLDNGFKFYVGFDFSKVALDIARYNAPEQCFLIGSAYEKTMYEYKYNVVIATEVLEHLLYDLQVLDNIKNDTTIICTLPDFNCEGHVRWFGTEEEIRKRYKDVIKIESIAHIKSWWLVNGVKI